MNQLPSFMFVYNITHVTPEREINKNVNSLRRKLL